MNSWKKHVKRAVIICGGQKQLGDNIGQSQQYIWNLINEAKSLKADVAILIEVATRGEVTRHDLRPDVFGERPEMEPAQ